MDKRYYSTPQEYAEREILPLLDDDAPYFDVEGITEDMSAAGLLIYTPGRGFSDLSLDAEGERDDWFDQELIAIIGNNDKGELIMSRTITVLRTETEPTTEANLAARIMAYESGELRTAEWYDLFAYLIKTGAVWSLQGSSLQGSYERTATALIKGGYITTEGDLIAQDDKEN